MIIDGRSGTGRLGMEVALHGTLIGKFARQDLQGKACFLNGCQVTGTREGQSESPGLDLGNQFGEFRQHRSDCPIDCGGGPLLDPGLFLDDALAIGRQPQAPIPQQCCEPSCSIVALQSRERDRLELLKPIQAPAVHAALKPHQALVATAISHRLKQQCLGIRAGTMLLCS